MFIVASVHNIKMTEEIKEFINSATFELESNKTKAMLSLLKDLNVDGKALIVTTELTDNILLASRNIRNIKLVLANELNKSINLEETIINPQNTLDNTGKILQIDGFEGEYLTQIEYLHLWTSKVLGSGIPFVVFNRQALMDIGGFVNYPLAWFNENISTAKNNKHSLRGKLKATRMFYDEHMEFILNYVPKNPEEEHLIEAIKHNLPRLIKKDKVRNQLRGATLSAILASIKSGVEIECVSLFSMLTACKYPFKYFFKELFRKRTR